MKVTFISIQALFNSLWSDKAAPPSQNFQSFSSPISSLLLADLTSLGRGGGWTVSLAQVRQGCWWAAGLLKFWPVVEFVYKLTGCQSLSGASLYRCFDISVEEATSGMNLYPCHMWWEMSEIVVIKSMFSGFLFCSVISVLVYISCTLSSPRWSAPDTKSLGFPHRRPRGILNPEKVAVACSWSPGSGPIGLS